MIWENYVEFEGKDGRLLIIGSKKKDEIEGEDIIVLYELVIYI